MSSEQAIFDNIKIFIEKELTLQLRKDFTFEKPKLLPKSIKFCDWYKNDALVRIYT